MPIAVRIDAIVIPCSRNRVRMRSASVVSSWRSRLNVSRILLIWDRRVALFVERASILACLSSSMSESTLSSFLIRSWISLFISVSSVSVSFGCSRARCLSTSDFRSSILVSFARLFANSSPIPVIAFSSPASSLLAWVTHTVSIGWSSIVVRVLSTCSALWRALSAMPGRSSSSMLSRLLGRVYPPAGVLSQRSYSDLSVCNQWVPAISAVHLYHPPRTSRPVLIRPGTASSPRLTNQYLFVARCPVEPFAVVNDPERVIVDTIGAQPISTVHFLIKGINQALLLGFNFCLSNLTTQGLDIVPGCVKLLLNARRELVHNGITEVKAIIIVYFRPVGVEHGIFKIKISHTK